MIGPGLIDKRLADGSYSGSVIRFSPSGKERMAIVYGKTLEELRRRKRAIVLAFQKTEAD